MLTGNVDGQAPSRVLVDHDEHANGSPVVSAICDEIVRPDVVGELGTAADARAVGEPQTASFRLFLWDLEPLLPPDALDPLVVHVPALPH